MPIYQAEQRLAKLQHLRNEIDLEIRSIERGLKLREKRARAITRRPRQRDAAPVAGDVQPRVVRAWARAQGLDVGTRGKVHHDIVQAYIDHHTPIGAEA